MLVNRHVNEEPVTPTHIFEDVHLFACSDRFSPLKPCQKSSLAIDKDSEKPLSSSFPFLAAYSAYGEAARLNRASRIS